MARDRPARGALRPVLLLLLFAVSFAVAQLSFFAERNLFDAGRFADHVESALQQPDVRREAGALLSEQIVRAEPDLIAVEPVIRSVSEGVAGSAAFRAIVRGAAYQLHASVFGAERDTFALTVTGAGLLVVQALEVQDPQAAAKVPEGIRSTLVSLSDGEFGKALTDLAQLADKIGALGWVALALALGSLFLLLGPDRDRRRNVRAAGYTLAATGAAVAVALELARSLVSAQAANDQAAAAVRALWDEFFRGVLAFNVAVAAAGLVVAAVADSRIRALDPLERVRVLAGAVAATPGRPWVRALRAAGLAAMGVFLVVSPGAALRLIAGAAGLLLVAVAADEVIAMTAQSPGEKGAARRPGRLRRPVLLAVLASVALAAPLVALAATSGPAEEVDLGTCNGSSDLCDRQVDEVAFPATHNSMSSPDSGFLIPDQQSGMVAQLEGGIRGLLIDTHDGVKTKKGVYTLLEPGGKSRDKIETAVGPDATRTALRLREQIGYRGGGDPQVYLCHGFCELGAIPAEGALRKIREFLAGNPGEVLVISIEDQVTPEETKAVFERSGLLDLVWTDSIDPLPTLGEMVERNRRVLVFGEEETGDVPWYHQQFDFVKETPFDVPSVARLLSPAACALNRGELANPLVLLNHWVAQTPPRPSTARQVNGADDITARARECEKELRGRPGLIAVDLWKEGDVVGAARSLNRSRASTP